MRTLFLVGLLLLSGPAFGQITVPESVPVGTELTATVDAQVPPGAEFKGGWSISCDGGCPATFRELKEPNTIGIWSTKIGVYSLTYRGYWVLVGQEITVVDVDGKEQKFKPYLGSGPVEESAVFEITGDPKPDPDPDPDPDPTPPPKAAWGLILEETGDRDSQWAVKFSSFRKAFDAMDYRLLILDETKLPSSLQPLLIAGDLAREEEGLDLPILIPVTADGAAGKVVECPDSVEGVKEKLGL